VCRICKAISHEAPVYQIPAVIDRDARPPLETRSCDIKIISLPAYGRIRIKSLQDRIQGFRLLALIILIPWKVRAGNTLASWGKGLPLFGDKWIKAGNDFSRFGLTDQVRIFIRINAVIVEFL
jgi:hypothetical protein